MGDWSTFEKANAIIPKVGGSLSLIACGLIIKDIILKWHKKRNVSLTSVLIFCISIADSLVSLFSSFLSTWMVPSDTVSSFGNKVYLASGNVRTCTTQGFFASLGVAASMSYYATLMVLYMLSVRYNWSENKMSNIRFRMYFILPPTIISLIIAVPPLFFDMYNFAGLYSCFLATYPTYCGHEGYPDCERGHGGWAYQDGYWIYCMVLTVIIIICVTILVWTVFSQERKHDKYLTPGQERRRVNTNKTIWQGIRYIGAFVLAYFSLYIGTIYRMLRKAQATNLLYYLLLIFPPLLGVFNAFVYFRPRYIQYRERHPDSKRIEALGQVFNIDLDLLERGSSQLSKRLSSLSRRKLSASTIPNRTTSDFSSGDDSLGDLTSPLFHADSSDSRDGEKAVSFHEDLETEP